MNKLIAALVVTMGITAFGGTETYEFKSTVKIPVVQGSAKKGYYRNYVSSSANGILFVSDSGSSYIDLTIGKTGERVILNVTTNDLAAVIYGKKQNGSAVYFTATNNTTLSLAFSGIGTTKVKTVGCDPCGTAETCTRVVNISGHLVGTYDCGCVNPQFATIDDMCDVDYTLDTTIAPVYGNWSMKLKMVDGAKYK